MSTGWKASCATIASDNPSERAYQKYLPEAEHLPPSHRKKWLYYKLFPNVAFDIYPDQVDFMQFLPSSATETVIREVSYALPDERREMKAARYLNWRINRRVNAEDSELITRVQQGMASAELRAGTAWGRARFACALSPRKLRALVPEARLESLAVGAIELRLCQQTSIDDVGFNPAGAKARTLRPAMACFLRRTEPPGPCRSSTGRRSTAG